MRHVRSGVVLVLAGMCFLPGTALAQILTQRCTIDSLDPIQAEARLGWMRRCALLKGADGPFDWAGIGMYEYVERGDVWSGQNMYTAAMDMGEINNSYVNKLYNSGPIYQNVDSNGFYRWYRLDSRKKARPYYPTYGNQYDVSMATQLFPHPTLATCGFYYDRAGTVPATGAPFYLNGFCEAVPGPTPLTSGVSVAVSGAMGSKQYYTLTVPAGIDSVTFQTSGGTGDLDLYVRFGAMPDESTYDCRPFFGGNNEGCNLASPNAGTWYVMLKGYSDYSGATLKGTYFY